MIYLFELDYSNHSYISITVCVKQLFLLRNILIFPCIYFPEKCYTHVRLEAYKKDTAHHLRGHLNLMSVSFFDISCNYSVTRFFILPRLMTKVEVL